ncbi:MAG: sulfatase [Candidatus Aminicenantia bacterium]
MSLKNTKLRLTIISVVLGWLTINFTCCFRISSEKFTVFRLIDQLSKENVIHSPLKTLNVKTTYLREVLSSRPLIEASSKTGNPFLIKRKLKIGGTELNTLFAPPKSLFKFEVKLPKNGILEFGYGVLTSSKQTYFSQVEFEIILVEKNKTNYLFKKTITTKENKIFPLRKIDLSYLKGKKVHLYLLTKGTKKVQSFWFNPVIYQPRKENKNLILISIDTLRADHLGCYGYQRKTSPNIDLLAKDSVLFTKTFASSPWTLPSHLSMMTSLNTINHKVYYKNQKLSPSIITLADILRENNYFCSAYTGGGFISGIYGFSKGFDNYNENVGGVFHRDSAERVFKAASSWLNKNKDKKFFLFLHTYQPHDPYFSPYPFNLMFLNEKAKRRYINLKGVLGGNAGIFKPLSAEERQNIIDLYDGEIRYTDECLIKPLINELKRLKLYHQTMIIFTSDHGEEFYDHGGWTHGHSLYSESIRVPLIIKFPQSKFKGKKIKDITRLIDIMPTVLEEMKIDYSEKEFDGKSLINLLSGKEKGDRVFISDVARNIINLHNPKKISINDGRYKLIFNENYPPQDLSFYSFSPSPIPHLELYNLTKDPGEQKNLAFEKKEIIEKLLKKLNNVYVSTKKGRPQKMTIENELKKQLKALGYIQN